MDSRDGEMNASIARGGPIYVPNLVGPLTRVPEFEYALSNELQELKAELCMDSSSLSTDDDVSVDELIVFSAEDLVEMALEEILNLMREKNGSSSQPSQEHLQARKENDLSFSSNSDPHLESSERGDVSAGLALTNGGNCCSGTTVESKSRKRNRYLKSSERSHTGTSCNGTIIDINARKGKGRKANKHAADESCLVKVDKVLKI